ncbi:MAG: 3-deoxy-8-phosphooctulonate synthase [Planctomycetes bacterium]|jgi:2-dehydro-3-deoxyphosphooctonate aldolase (KDO 8-P synthase)|nr:3-deoxy-8-phosphooctulonate synthase [Planctomycetota bacterium]
MPHATRILEDFFGHPHRRLLLIGGPCVLESDDINRRIGQTLREACARLGIDFCFKASFDKANRSSGKSHRGPGMQAGLDRLAKLREELACPVTSDVHEPEQCLPAAKVLDMLQVPAFLCRQTDLLMAAAETGRPVNVKKGQFMSPREMQNVVRKLSEGGCRHIMATERGTTFGYNRLVNDFIGIGDMMELGHPVCFDVTHSTQLPGAEGERTGGRPERAPMLARAAVAAGVHAIFLECHPTPSAALSDASTMQPLDAVPAMLASLVAIRKAMVESGCWHV